MSREQGWRGHGLSNQPPGAFDGAGAPAFLYANRPQVVVVNNGPRKGMGQADNTVQSVTPPGARVAPYEKNACLRLVRYRASKASGRNTYRCSIATPATIRRRT